MSNARNIADKGHIVGRKNLIINGGMQVSQRGMGTGIGAVNSTYNADRWKLQFGAVSPRFTVTQGTGPTGVGKSLKYATTTTVTTSTTNTYIQVVTLLEGQDTQGVAKGTPSAKSLTLSFWVKANQTGVYAALLYEGVNNRQNSSSYTVSSADTWEKKTITFAPDTTGTLPDTSSGGLQLTFILAAGSQYTGGSTGISEHGANNASYAPNQSVNVAANVGDYWEIAEVQLELGSVATDFEHRSYGEELALCQRYYQRFTAGGTGTGAMLAVGASQSPTGSWFFSPVLSSMRGTPTISFSSLIVSDSANYDLAVTAVVVSGGTASTDSSKLYLQTTHAGSATQYRAANLRAVSNTAGYLAFDSEL